MLSMNTNLVGGHLMKLASKGADMKSDIRYEEKNLFFMIIFSSFLDVKSRYKLRT
jgi:hypothetical protein